MTTFNRYAVYYAPPAGPLAEWGATWLGWDPVAAAPVPHPEIPGLPLPVAEITATPRKYGFHGTLKPPFRLTGSVDALRKDLGRLATGMAPVPLDGLELSRLGRFLALTPLGETAALAALAARVVRDLDTHRAPPTEAELTRRRAARLSPAQEANLERWGYPYVMEQFRFHMTLTGRLPPGVLAGTRAALAPAIAPMLPRPFVINALSLFGEDADGQFHQIEQVPLTG